MSIGITQQEVQVAQPQVVYVVLYIHVDQPEFSEVLGIYMCKADAVRELLERAGYRLNNQGELTQYMVPTNEYPSYEYLRQRVDETSTLIDVDIYRIVEKVVR